MIQQILSNKKREIALNKEHRTLDKIRAEVEKKLNHTQAVSEFKKSITVNGFSIVAEIKRKSPSHGEIRNNLNVDKVAKAYNEEMRISGISVLTDHQYFGGSLNDIKSVRSVTTKPLLRKEFILDEYQIYESRIAGADAVLLISTILDEKKLKDLVQLTRHLGMEPFVECHTRLDIEKIPFDEVEVVGINSRDLVGTLKTDLRVIEKMLPLIPPNKIVIAESGVHTETDLKWIYDLGINAVLIGAGILRHDDISGALRKLLSLIP